MAIEFTSWEADGKGQTKVSSIRSDCKDWRTNSNAWLTQQEQNNSVVLITKSRTDKQSNIEHIIWQKPGYVDPCTEE